jgi:hypothetical protein
MFKNDKKPVALLAKTSIFYFRHQRRSGAEQSSLSTSHKYQKSDNNRTGKIGQKSDGNPKDFFKKSMKNRMKIF